LEQPNGASAWGMAAELLAPKWFDKNSGLSNEDNFNQLRRSLQLACDGYLNTFPSTAYDLFANHYPQQVSACAAEQLNQLIAGYGPALLDRAVLDALCRLNRISFEQAIKANLPGIRPAGYAPDLNGFDMDIFLASLLQWNSVYARHTVGLTDNLMCDDVSKPLADGLPETLEDAINVYGYRYFKLKISGDIATDLERLNRIANVLDRISKVYYVTLDGNEQYTDTRQISELWRRIVADPVLHRFSQAVLFIEQPLNRDIALQQDVAELSREKPVIIDESDMAPDSFVKAKQRGYKGVSSKSCKGIYRSLINAARCAHWNHQEHGGYFLTAEDLSTQAGLALQQDLALVCLLGIEHVERNGHFYGGGFSPQQPVEAQSFLQAHPDLYGENDHQQVQLRITEGKIHTSSLRRSGFASDAEPDWSVMVNSQKPQNA
jgi:hypothetical protein